MFFLNFVLWLGGLLLMGIGVYATMDKWDSGEVFKFDTVFDVIINIGLLVLIVGFVIFVVSLAGCIGSLRENTCLLRIFSFFMLVFFLLGIITSALCLTSSSSIYPKKITTFLEKEFDLSDKLISRYRDNLDYQNLIDFIQHDFRCCGLTDEADL